MTTSGPQDSVTYVLVSPLGDRAVFNDPTDPDYVGMARWTGLDSPEIRENTTNRVEEDGAIHGDFYKGPRPVVGTIEIVPTSTSDRNDKSDILQRASRAFRADATLTWTPDGGVEQFIRVRRNGPLRRAEEPGWVTKYSLPLVAEDPRIYATTLNSEVDPNAVTNAGSSDTPPEITVTVPSDGRVEATNGVDNVALDVTLTDWTAYNIAETTSLTTPLAVDVAVDSLGNIYVTNTGVGDTIFKYDSSGNSVDTFGPFGSDDGEFTFPWGIEVDASDNLLVVDHDNNRVQKLDSSGTFISKFGTMGLADGKFEGPSGIAIDSSGNIFVTDIVHHHIQKFDSSGNFLARTGTLGSGNGQFNGPYGVAVDSAGNVFVADTNNHRIQKLTNNLVYTSQFGSSGSGEQGLASPRDISIATGNNDLIFVTDSNNQRLMVFDNAGAFVAQKALGTTLRGVKVAADGSTLYHVQDNSSNRTTHISSLSSAALTLVLDFANRSVVSGAGENAYRTVDPDSEWWTLQPGENAISVAGASTYTVEWRDAWE